MTVMSRLSLNISKTNPTMYMVSVFSDERDNDVKMLATEAEHRMSALHWFVMDMILESVDAPAMDLIVGDATRQQRRSGRVDEDVGGDHRLSLLTDSSSAPIELHTSRHLDGYSPSARLAKHSQYNLLNVFLISLNRRFSFLLTCR